MQVTGDLFDVLTEQILQTDDDQLLDKMRMTGYFLMQSVLTKFQPKKPSIWFNTWKNSVSYTDVPVLQEALSSLPNIPLPILHVLDSLKSSNLHFSFQKKEEPVSIKPFRIVPTLPDSQVVMLVKSVLLGKEPPSVLQNKAISRSHMTIIHKMDRIIRSLRLIDETHESFVGKIGHAMHSYVKNEYQHFVDTIPENTSLIGLYSALSGNTMNRILSTAILCFAVSQVPKGLSLLNAVTATQQFGLPDLIQLSSQLVDAGLVVMLKMIRDWVVYGVLDDSDNEFFVSKSPHKVNSYKWWTAKYVLIHERVPIILNGPTTVARIYQAGRSHNFLRKYRDSCYNYVNNFGSDAPFAITKESKKPPRPDPDAEWEGPPFELSMVRRYSDEAMESMMYMINSIVWISGHLAVVRDFLMFGRGDFATNLHDIFAETGDGDPPAMLFQTINIVTRGIAYTNSITKENLTHRIDFKRKPVVQPRPEEIVLQYRVNPPIDAILTPTALDHYSYIGRFVWKLKCCECDLAEIWQKSRRYTNLVDLGFNVRHLDFLRYVLVHFVQTMIEYLATDVILDSWNSLVEQKNFNELLQVHEKHLLRILDGCLLSQTFAQHYQYVLNILETASKFATLTEELDLLYADLIKRVPTMRRKSHLLEKYMRNLSGIQDRVITLQRTLDEQLQTLYIMVHASLACPEMQHLESRLHDLMTYLD